ncbi:MAG TPA: primosomal protein N' [Candidatus Methylacidiphilales bacterium]|jgi:primosomal protein N' (replication factor Y)|nr:primosomal protein N' [Candidatus Methylacidiphilales bacterium]
MVRIARVVPEVSLDRAFDYAIPAELDAQLTLGAKVRVPFKSRDLVGYVVEFPKEPFTGKLKPIREILGPRSFLPASLIELAQWMARYYCAPLTVALLSVLPRAVRRADAAFKQRLWVEPLAAALPDETARALKKARSQMAAWDYLRKNGPGWLAELTQSSGCGPAAWRALAERNLVSIESRAQDRDPFLHSPVAESIPHEMNPEQRAALEIIAAEIAAEKPRVVLLHGVTGSGKTEVYLQAIARVLALGKSALVLVPEIALTPQTVEHFRARFIGEKVGVAVLHSHLSSGERHDQWQHIRAGRARIVIGARSAVFAPLDNLGVIVVDEEHEHSYKQEESPHYHARDVAVMRGHLERVAVVLGSATPSLESYHHAREGKYRLVELLQRVEEGQMPVTHVLDIRSTTKGGPPALVAPQLVEAIKARIERHEQAIIFLNRRGYSSSLQCPRCGHVEMCPNCSVALTFHRGAGKLRCHLCDFSSVVPHACPQCGASPFKHSGSGTEKVEHALAGAFPGARIERMDSDNMRGRDAYTNTLRDFADGKIDILVGTQMIAKGLHFPRVTCVGVINADLALQIPDFRAGERVFQLLMQVSGRSGRGQVRGEVFVQTRVPFHPAIQFARHHDYAGFAEQELGFRRSLHYPPYERFVLVTARGRSEEKTLFVIENLAKEIERLDLPGAEITGPVPAPIARIEDRYRFQIFLRARRIMAVTPRLRPLFMDRAWPDDIRVTIDVDPVDLL